MPKWLPQSPARYSLLDKLKETEPETVWMPLWRLMGKADLYFLVSRILSSSMWPKLREGNQWLFERCREFQAQPDGHIDIWARDHGKTTIITVGDTIREILNNPEITVAIFSFSRPAAKVPLNQIKREFESNDLLKSLYPDVLWSDPSRESPKWSEDEGLIVRRRGNPREATLEAWGLVDSQPIGRHFDLRVYDDVVTADSVFTPDQNKKTTERWQLSENLGKEGGRRRIIGTRYHLYDTYHRIIESGAAKPRLHPCMDKDGNPVLYSREFLEEKKRQMSLEGFGTWACQMMCDPLADDLAEFDDDWLMWYDNPPMYERQGKNVLILVDPANEKRRENDMTAMWVVGLGPDEKIYILDAVRDRLNLTERTEKLFALHQRWRPYIVVYEKYSMQADIEHIKYVQNIKRYRFEIKEVGGRTKKEDRIRRLIPIMQQGRMWFPRRLIYRDYLGRQRDLVQAFITEELRPFPLCKHDDMLDSLARIEDVTKVYPTSGMIGAIDAYDIPDPEPDGSWMAA